MLETTLVPLQFGLEVLVIGGLLISLVFFVLWVGLAYWVYKDATERDMDNALLWGVVTFALGIIGLVIYLVVRE